MANRAVTLYLRIKTPEGKKPYCKPVFLAKGRLKPLYAFVDGEPEHCPEGVYCMRFGADSGKQQLVPLGNDPYLALDKVAEKERWLRDRERGMVTPIPENPKQESAPIEIVLELDELPFSGTMESLSIIMQNAPIECGGTVLTEVFGRDLFVPDIPCAPKGRRASFAGSSVSAFSG